MGGFFIFLSVVLLLMALAATALIRFLAGGRAKEDRRLEGEEAKMMQELYRGLNDMERRMEALETIVADRGRKEGER